MEVMESPQKPAAAVPGARTRATRVLLAVAALLLCAPMAWLVTATLTVKQMSLSRVQVRLNFAALIDWSTEGPSMSADSTCSQVREPWCLLCWRSQVLHLLLLLPWTRAAGCLLGEAGSHSWVCSPCALRNPQTCLATLCAARPHAGLGNTDRGAHVPHHGAHPA